MLEGWCRSALAEPMINGTPKDVMHPQARAWCANGAIILACCELTGRSADNFWSDRMSSFLASHASAVASRSVPGGGDIVSYNNVVAERAEDVAAVLRDAADEVRARGGDGAMTAEHSERAREIVRAAEVEMQWPLYSNQIRPLVDAIAAALATEREVAAR